MAVRALWISFDVKLMISNLVIDYSENNVNIPGETLKQVFNYCLIIYCSFLITELNSRYPVRRCIYKL